MADFNTDLIPKNLVQSAKKNNCGLFVGAGLSINAGFPCWEDLLLELIENIEQDNITSKKKIKELKKLAKNPAKYLLVAEEIKDILPSGLHLHIKTKFDNPTINPKELHKKLFQIKNNFIVTTNYDTLLENAFVQVYNKMPTVYTYKDAASINYNLCNNEPFILKAHGDSSRAPKEIILTDKDYRGIIYNERGYQSVLHVIFSSYTILFLGVSLNDPEILLLLGFIHHIFHGGSPQHYALMPKNKVTDTEIDRWRKDYNIYIITYDPVDNHKQVEQFVEGLIQKQND